MAYSQFTLVLAPVPLSNSVHTQYHLCVYTTCKGREMCMRKIQLVYTRVVLCVWPQNYLCMSTIASPLSPILRIHNTNSVRTQCENGEKCVCTKCNLCTWRAICVYTNHYLCMATDVFCVRPQTFLWTGTEIP